jgi:hypothetical protein
MDLATGPAEESEARSMTFPRIFRVRRQFGRPCVTDVRTGVNQELDRLNLRARVHSGETVAITAGSRGIAHLHLILKAVVDYFEGFPRSNALSFAT